MARQSMRSLYNDFPEWWPLMSAPSEYEEEAAIYADLLQGACDGPIETLLELGSGGGNNALFMKKRFGQLVLTDLAPGMLEVSRALNPECEHQQGDMRDLRLDQTFDAVFVHDAVCYMATEGDLRRAMTTAAEHCRPSGAVLFAPDHISESFHAYTDEGGHDEDPRAPDEVPRGLRYLGWAWDRDPDDGLYEVDYAFILRERDGSTRAVHESHQEGLFSRARWLELLSDVGFEARAVPLEHSEVEPGLHEMFVGTRRP
ncbi:MAG: class I SAM-dependent methyltransferase [Acidobacteriota bacterium]|nr:class I SAM-dependent methyltransferase [Acidobacteriota bacterium]